MDWSKAIIDTIDMRSFSNVWYWIGVTVLWSSLSHWVLGVPYDLIMRAKRHGGDAEQDLVDIVRVNVNRILTVSRTSGMWLTGLNFFIVSSLALLAFLYGFELAQAFLLMLFPALIVGWLSVSTARKIERDVDNVEMLFKMLNSHRVWTQVIGMIAIFITAMYGMYNNLSVPEF